MTEQKKCIRCERPIDAYARICPYCNWDQNDPAVQRATQPAEVAYVPPEDRNLRKYVFMGAGAVLLLIVSFALGSLVHGKNPPKTAKGVDASQQVEMRPAPHANVTLVPAGANDTIAVEAPITSAPVLTPTQGLPPEYQRSDATAVSSAEYAQLAARAKAEKKKEKELVDPRTLTGPAYAQQTPERPEHPQMSSSAEPSTSSSDQKEVDREERERRSTNPVPEYQPLPDISVDQTTTVRLVLTIGSDGRVREVNVLQGIPGQTSKIISAVQSWRFKPATENGVPVSAPFSVDLSFRGNE